MFDFIPALYRRYLPENTQVVLNRVDSDIAAYLRRCSSETSTNQHRSDDAAREMARNASWHGAKGVAYSNTGAPVNRQLTVSPASVCFIHSVSSF